MLRKVLVWAAFCLSFASLKAQVEPYLSVECMGHVHVPSQLSLLTVDEGSLYANCNGLQMALPLNGTSWQFLPDTTWVKMDDEVNYAVKNPRTGTYFYTVPSDRGTALYERVKPRGLGASRSVRPEGWHAGIEHPVFSSDGNWMFFSSDGGNSLGGYDIWCSHWNGNRWGAAINMGLAVNTADNEVSPMMYDDYLIFSSNGHDKASVGYTLYSAKVLSNGDVDGYMFDHHRVQRLPMPINSAADDWELSYDPVSRKGYWLSNRSGNDQLYSFEGLLEGVMLWGQVVDAQGNSLSGAQVTIVSHDRNLVHVATNEQGVYSVFLRPGESYVLSAWKPDYYVVSEPIVPARPDEQLLCSEVRHQITLPSLPIGRVLHFYDLFGTDADLEMSPSGLASLDTVVRFLRENPHLRAEMSLMCDQTDNEMYNKMLTQRRMDVLKLYFRHVLPPETEILLKNEYDNGVNETSGRAESVLFVTFFAR